MSDDIIVRILGMDDYNRFVAVWRAAGLHSLRLHGRDSRAAMARQLATGTHTLLGLELKGQLVAAVLATHDGRKGWINRLCVLPRYRRRNYGALLVAEAERVLREQGMTVIAALIEPGNDASLALFSKLGYVESPGLHYVSKRDNEDA